MGSPTRLVIQTQYYLQVLTLVINQAEIQDMSKLSFVEFYIVAPHFLHQGHSLLDIGWTH